MKKLAVLFFVFLISLSVFGQNGLKRSRYFLLRKDEKTISVNTFENGIKEVKSYPITEKSLFTTASKKQVAILDTAKNTISLYGIDTATELKLTIPFEINPLSILLNEDNLFIGSKQYIVIRHVSINKFLYNFVKCFVGEKLY